jgi:hypothetical protein
LPKLKTKKMSQIFWPLVSFAILSSWVFLTVGTSTALFALINPE